MIHGKKSFRALGLAFLASLGLMAFVASAAQGHDWLLEKMEMAPGTAAKGKFDEALTSQSLLVPNSNLRIKCAEFKLTETQFILLPKAPEAHATILFENCKAFEHKLDGIELTKCHVIDTLGGTALHVTAKVKFLVLLHTNGELYLLAEPLTAGTAFATIRFLPGIGCTLPLANEVKGSLALQIDGGNKGIQADEVEHLLKPFPQNIAEIPTQLPLFNDGLTFGANRAVLDGNVWITLIGDDENKKWGIC